jgi:hypothetical protein
MSDSTALAVRGDGSLDDLSLAKAFWASGYFSDVQKLSQAIAKIQAGREQGIGPMAAMMSIHVIQGKPAYSSGLMAGIIKRSGRYNYRVLEHTEKVCEIEFFEEGQSIGKERYTMDDAVTAEHTSGKNSHTWRKFPRNMLFNRAMSNGAKMFCADLFLGGVVYTPEELGARVDGNGEIIDAGPPDIKVLPNVIEGEVLDTEEELEFDTPTPAPSEGHPRTVAYDEPGPDYEQAAPRATQQQRERIGQLGLQLGYDDAKVEARVRKLYGVPLAELNQAQADNVLDLLAKAAQGRKVSA